MTDVARTLRNPKRLFEVTIERRPYLRRLLRALIILLATSLAWVALNLASERVEVDVLALEIGKLAAVIIMLLAGIRAVVNLVRWRNRPDETLSFFDRGFIWERNGEKYQYRWEKLRTFREGGHAIYRGKRPVIQWGHHTLEMTDGRVFRLVPRHGELRQLARAIRPYAAEVTGIRMGRRLRQEKPVRVHPRLVVWPGGLQIGKEELPWSVLNVTVRGSRLIVQAKQNGKVRTVGRFATNRVDNLGGFMELATATIRNHR
jgi:hypothetical protein